MACTWTYLAAAAALLWAVILLLPWRPWQTRERLDADPRPPAEDLSDITVLIPARDEAAVIPATLAALAAQGPGLRVVVVDDESTDGTAETARALGLPGVSVVASARLPAGWTGKLWALEQGRRRVTTRLTLLLDADIRLEPGTVAALRRKADRERIELLSLMAAPVTAGAWERLLMPAFVYFFKLLYPFRLANSRYRGVAAAAGGCILVATGVLQEIGGFAAIRGALIDDCTLAARVKAAGHRTWIGLTHSARMLRRNGLGDIWDMVARTAFTQLRYSVTLLLLCTGALGLAFAVPVAGLAVPGAPRVLSAAALGLMAVSYRPTLRYYGLPWAWALALPAIGVLYLAMTWTSALRYARGYRSRWKGRDYAKAGHGGP